MPPDPPALRVGVIGLRRGASLMHSCQSVGGATVTALFDPDHTRLQAAASDIGATAYRELDAFLDADIDLVVVASPMPFHAEQSIAALEAGKHVLCEVLPCRTTEEAREIVRTARLSRGRFFVSENCIFYDEIELVRRLHTQGRFGEIYYGEGDYIHDCEGLWFDSRRRRTWRGEGKIGVYGTHGIGPLLYIIGVRVTQVRCTALPEGIVNPDVPIPTMHLLEMRGSDGRVFRSRVDVLSPRPHLTTTTYRIQGTAGSYESATGTARQGRIWLRDAHEPSRYDASASWHELEALIDAELADRRMVNAVEGGHGTSEFWLLTSVFAAIRSGTICPIELDAAFDFTLPCIVAGESARQGGIALPVPDSREW